jgi:hypothetical protein
MTDPVDTLRQSLARLHEQLSVAPPLDGDARALLAEIQRDIERLSRGGPAAAGDAPQPGRRGRLETLAVKFEGGHPRVAAALREVVELLAQAGI